MSVPPLVKGRAGVNRVSDLFQGEKAIEAQTHECETRVVIDSVCTSSNSHQDIDQRETIRFCIATVSSRLRLGEVFSSKRVVYLSAPPSMSTIYFDRQQEHAYYDSVLVMRTPSTALARRQRHGR